LQQLLRAELISQRRSSRQVIYATNFQTMNALVAYLTENCCGSGAKGACAAPVCKPGVGSAQARPVARKKSA
jgi:hypothetical protein